MLLRCYVACDRLLEGGKEHRKPPLALDSWCPCPLAGATDVVVISFVSVLLEDERYHQYSLSLSFFRFVLYSL